MRKVKVKTSRWNLPVYLCGIVILIFAGPTLANKVYGDPERTYSAFSEDKHRQFDFWIGEWDVNLRVLDENQNWNDRIAAKAHIYSILNGKAILELWDSDRVKGYSLRYFDPAEDQWVLWLNWAGKNRSSSSSLKGSFRHGRGDFHAEYTNADGDTVLQRYSFNDITPFSLRWDDLNSIDGGVTWRKNWRMEFSRRATEPKWPISLEQVPTYVDGQRCDAETFRPYEVLAGNWTGLLNGSKATISARKILDGCALLLFLDIDSEMPSQRFMLLSYDTLEDHWETSYLDDNRNHALLRLTSADNWSDVSQDNNILNWNVDEEGLTYRFIDASGVAEAGKFTRALSEP